MWWFLLAVGIGFGADVQSEKVDDYLGAKLVVNKDLFGEQMYGVYAHGDSFVGILQLSVGKAKRVKGGGYSVNTTIAMGLGEIDLTIRESALVSSRFAMIESEGRVGEGGRGEPTVPLESKHAFQEDNRWVVEMHGGEEATIDRVLTTGPNRAGMWGMLLLARSLSGLAAGTYTMEGVLPTGVEPAYAEYPLLLTLGEPLMHKLRDVEHTAQLIQVSAATGWVFSLVVSEGQVLEMWSNDFPMTFAICHSEEECQKNLDKGLSDQNLSLGPIDVIRIFYNAMGGNLAVSALNEIVDWESCAASFDKGSGETATPEALANLFAEGFGLKGTIDEALLEAKLLMLEVTVDGNHAIVRSPDHEGVFRLRKQDDRWKLIELPL